MNAVTPIKVHLDTDIGGEFEYTHADGDAVANEHTYPYANGNQHRGRISRSRSERHATNYASSDASTYAYAGKVGHWLISER